MRKVILVFLPIAVALVACRATPVVVEPHVVIETAAQPVIVNVEVADTPESRRRGLMGRESLPENAGMLFIWPEDASSAFFMKDTLIPLSIAFIASDGRILRILEMEPCRADPCPTYDPETSYRMALEVNQGAFERLGVREGDRARLVR